MQMVKVWLGEDDGILGGGAPGLHEVYGIATAQGGVSSEHHTGRLEHRPQLPVQVREVLQTTTADELEQEKKTEYCNKGGREGEREGETMEEYQGC